MKFLCDVHISYKVCKFLEQYGHQAIHVNTILDKWFTDFTHKYKKLLQENHLAGVSHY